MAFISAIPKLASIDIQRSLAFYQKLGFAQSAHYPDYGIVEQDGVQIHFWLCTDAAIPKATGCRIGPSHKFRQLIPLKLGCKRLQTALG